MKNPSFFSVTLLFSSRRILMSLRPFLNHAWNWLSKMMNVNGSLYSYLGLTQITIKQPNRQRRYMLNWKLSSAPKKEKGKHSTLTVFYSLMNGFGKHWIMRVWWCLGEAVLQWHLKLFAEAYTLASPTVGLTMMLFGANYVYLFLSLKMIKLPEKKCLFST